jgi:hypothetical protein
MERISDIDDTQTGLPSHIKDIPAHGQRAQRISVVALMPGNHPGAAMLTALDR